MLSYHEQGEGSPVLLIHGFPLDSRMWRPQVEALSEAGFRVVCPDLPGFGDSASLAGEASMSGYADAVIALLDDLGIERAAVGGMSMGGYVLFDLLARYPQRVSAAMFLVTRAAADDAAGREKRTALAAVVAGGDLLVVPEAFAGVLFASQTPAEKPALVAEVRSWMEAVSADGLVGGLLAMRERADYLDRLSDFDVPALVVGAAEDRAVPPEHARVLAAGLPQAELRLLPGAGHMANLEQPELFNEALLAFLKQAGCR